MSSLKVQQFTAECLLEVPDNQMHMSPSRMVETYMCAMCLENTIITIILKFAQYKHKWLQYFQMYNIVFMNALWRAVKRWYMYPMLFSGHRFIYPSQFYILSTCWCYKLFLVGNIAAIIDLHYNWLINLLWTITSYMYFVSNVFSICC